MDSNAVHEMSIGKTLSVSFDDAIARVETALAAEGFGVLTRIDVKATLEKKLGVQVAPEVILGACNPPIAHRALQIEPRIALLLPCNVVVRQEADGIRVEAVSPHAMVAMFPGRGLDAVADEATARLTRAIAAL